jgi:hypothetical protein
MIKNGEGNIMKYSTIEDLPMFLSAQDVAGMMSICLAHAYELFHSKDFPSIRIGRRLLVSKLAFVNWMQDPKLNK